MFCSRNNLNTSRPVSFLFVLNMNTLFSFRIFSLLAVISSRFSSALILSSKFASVVISFASSSAVFPKSG
jgi:hypothetical protein